MSEEFSEAHAELLQRLERGRDALDRAVAAGNREAAAREIDQILDLAEQFDALDASAAARKRANSVPEQAEAVALAVGT